MKKRSRKRTKKHNRLLDSIIIVLLAVLSGILYENSELLRNIFDSKQNLYVHFIYVGQADCTLIESPDGTILIDGGESNTAGNVIKYLKDQGISTIDYIIATHPHSDHIGGLPQIINEFKVGNIIMPDAVNTTVIFDKFLTAIDQKHLAPITPVPGSQFRLGDMKFTIIAPNSSKYDNLNNYSIGLKLSYGQVSFLFTGDAESMAESEILSAGFDIRADVFKAGHHGSRTSNTAKLIDAIKPSYCVISCGLNNDYGHPHEEVLDRLKDRGINVLRTDTSGTIIIETDGQTIKTR